MSDKKKYKNYREYFDNQGGDFIHPKSWGVTHDISIEELYQHFRDRLIDEVVAIHREEIHGHENVYREFESNLELKEDD